MQPASRTNAVRSVAAFLLCLAGTASAQPTPSLDLTAAEAGEMLLSMAPKNAALLYYQILLQADQRLFDSWVYFNEDPDDDAGASLSREEAEQAMKDGEGVIGSLVIAANMPECDFGIQYQKGWSALLPHLGKLRSAARLLLADANRLLEAGDAEGAAARIDAVYAMGRQLRGDRILISSLVSAAICSSANKAVATVIESGDLNEAGRDLLISRLEAFEAEEDPFGIRECVTMEGFVSLGWLANEFPDGHAGTPLAASGFLDGSNKGLIATLDAMDGERMRREAERMIQYYRDVLRQWDAPDAVSRMEALGAALNVGGYGELAKGFAASLSRARERDLSARAEIGATLDSLRAYRPEKAETGEPATPTPAGR